jgi:hypothetical protein
MITLLTAILFAVTDFPSEPGEPERVWHVRNESRLAIHGNTNVNDFRCEVDQYYSADNLHLHSSHGTNYRFTGNEIVISLMEFDCGRTLITRDFRESLNADRNPEMLISFLSLDRIPSDYPSTGGEDITGWLEVTIAGVTKEIDIVFSATGNGNGITYLNGKHDFLFSDFGLVPPTRMLGLITVKNELEVTFNLVLEEQ